MGEKYSISTNRYTYGETYTNVVNMKMIGLFF